MGGHRGRDAEEESPGLSVRGFAGLLLVALVTTGCGAAAATGTITGHLTTIDASGQANQPTAGTVEAHIDSATGAVVGSAKAASDGTFQIRVPEGTYYLTANVGSVLCLADNAVTIIGSSTGAADVVCTTTS